MKARKPTKITTMGGEYTVVFKPMVTLYGEVDFLARKILISTTQSDTIQKESLLHEIIHVCLEECDALGHGKIKDREEAIIRHLSPRLFQMLRDNPKVKHYIFD